LDGKDFTGESPVAGVTTGAFQLTAPTAEADANGYSSIRVKWNKIAVPGATVTYVLQRSTKKTEGFKPVYTGSKRDNTDTGLEASTRYYYKVVAVTNIAGVDYRAESKVVSAKTSARPVSNTGTSTTTTTTPRYNPPEPDPEIHNPDEPGSDDIDL